MSKNDKPHITRFSYEYNQLKNSQDAANLIDVFQGVNMTLLSQTDRQFITEYALRTSDTNRTVELMEALTAPNTKPMRVMLMADRELCAETGESIIETLDSRDGVNVLEGKGVHQPYIEFDYYIPKDAEVNYNAYFDYAGIKPEPSYNEFTYVTQGRCHADISRKDLESWFARASIDNPDFFVITINYPEKTEAYLIGEEPHTNKTRTTILPAFAQAYDERHLQMAEQVANDGIDYNPELDKFSPEDTKAQGMQSWIVDIEQMKAETPKNTHVESLASSLDNDIQRN